MYLHVNRNIPIGSTASRISRSVQHLTGTLHECLHTFLERKSRSGFTWVLKWRNGKMDRIRHWLKIGSRSMDFELGVTKSTRSSTWVDCSNSFCWGFMIILLMNQIVQIQTLGWCSDALGKTFRDVTTFGDVCGLSPQRFQPGGIEHVLNDQGSPVLGFSEPLSDLALMIDGKSGYVEQ